MSRRLLYFAILLACVVALAWWIRRINSRPPEVPASKVRRQTLVSALTTNGKVEPYQWMAVRAARQGVVEKVHVEKGQRVAQGAVLAEMDATEARAQLASANAQVAQAEAELATLRQGGRPADLAEIDSQIARARMDLSVAQRDHESLQRLAQKSAATQQEVFDARQRMLNAEQQIAALEKKRAALVSPPDTASAQAKLKQALAARQAAQALLDQSVSRAPMTGTIYQLDIRPGAYLNPGDLVAMVGRLERLRVNVYVDEPDLGRVGPGMPVTITWDALPGRQWKAAVDRVPTEVIKLDTRQVGEVGVVIDNPGEELLPGVNVNAEIVSQTVTGALVLPKEAVRRRGAEDGVFVLKGEQVFWQPVKLGVSSVTEVQAVSGVSEGDTIALGTEQPLENGERIRPVYR